MSKDNIVPPLLVSAREAWKLLGCANTLQFYRVRHDLGIRPVTCGRYSINEIRNAIARRELINARSTDSMNARFNGLE